MIEKAPHSGGRRVIGLLLAVAAAPLAPPSSPPAAAAEGRAAIIERIGEVVVSTPPCGELPCKRIYSPEKVRGWLGEFVGERFDERRITGRIERRYTYLGYRPSIVASLRGSELRLSVLEAPAAVAEVTADPNLIAPYLPPGALAALDPVDRPYVPLRAVRARAGDLVDRERLLADEFDLSMLGYDLVRVPQPADSLDAPRRYAIVRRIPRRVWRGMREEAAKGGPPQVGEGSGNTGRKEDGAEAEEAAPRTVKVEPLTRTWIDGTADYSRRQLFTAQLTWRRAHVVREFDLIELTPYVARRFAGGIRYYTPYILPESITPWNLFGEVRLYDDFTPDRLFTHTSGSGPAATTTVFQADEERRGAEVALGLEPFRHWNGHSLLGKVYVNRYHVGFTGCSISVNCGGFAATDPRIPGSSQNDINLVGTSFEYSYEHLFRAPRLSWKFIPTAEVATKARGGDLAFRRFLGEIRQHYAFSTGFEIDTSWKAGIVDRRVPIFEQFTLGGPDSLRGFLRDDFFGRRFLSAQNDLWIPIPFRAISPDSDLMALLQRNLKVALLLDGGSVSFEEIRDVHFARGIGIGLRYAAEKSPLLVSIDAAWGYWQGVKRFYPYVSFTRRW